MIKEIKSKENRIFKDCQKLSQKKYRDREGCYLIEGPNLLEEALTNNADIVCVIFDEDKVKTVNFDGDLYKAEHKLFTKLSQTENSQGVLAIIRKSEYDAKSFMKYCPEGGNVVVLDRLQDPGNIGTIIRTAEGAGYAAVISIKGTADIYAPKTIRAAAGSVFRIPIIHVEDNRELRRFADSAGKKLAVTSLDADNYYYDVNLKTDTALVIGNEGNGVSSELIEMADIKVKIPMSGRLESLNASVAAGILMYEAVRSDRKQND